MADDDEDGADDRSGVTARRSAVFGRGAAGGAGRWPPPGSPERLLQIFGDTLYEIYYRFLETEDEYFDYAPAPVPPQGRWRIYGIGLPEAILRQVYHDNAARLLGLDPL